MDDATDEQNTQIIFDPMEGLRSCKSSCSKTMYCIYITLLPCSVGSKVPSASGLHCGLAPLVIVTIVG